MVRCADFFAVIYFLVLVFCPALPGFAAEGAPDEIAHLLTYIEASDCTFVRNGKEYSAADGRRHIERKYDHLKNKIDSTEEFIKYAATKSSMSGRLYKVICNDEKMLSGEWLHRELKHFRTQLPKDQQGQ